MMGKIQTLEKDRAQNHNDLCKHKSLLTVSCSWAYGKTVQRKAEAKAHAQAKGVRNTLQYQESLGHTHARTHKGPAKEKGRNASKAAAAADKQCVNDNKQWIVHQW